MVPRSIAADAAGMSQLRQRSPREPAQTTPNRSAAAATAYVSFPSTAQMASDRRAAAAAASAAPLPPASVFARSASMDDDDLAAKATTQQQPKDRRSLAWTFITFIFSAPALLGMCQKNTEAQARAAVPALARRATAEFRAESSRQTSLVSLFVYFAGCWPSVLAAAIGGGVSGGARVLSHTISFYVTLTVMLAMLSYFAYCTRTRAQLHTTHLKIYGPLYLLFVASLLILADPLRHVLQDGGVWVGPSSNAFREGCGEGWGCLTTTGIFFCVVFTYLGFAAMFTASAWNGNLLAKCRLCAREWKDIRQAQAKQALEDANAAREEAARARSSVGEAASMPTNPVAFNTMHVTMAPPTFVFRAEQSNKLGYRIKTATPLSAGAAAGETPTSTPPTSSTNRSSRRATAEDSVTSTPEAGTSTSAAPSPVPATTHSGRGSPSSASSRAGEYKDEGYSYEVRSPAVMENVVKISARKAQQQPPQQQPQQPHVSSPTVTTSPSDATTTSGVSLHPVYPSDSPASGLQAPFSSPFSNVALTPVHPLDSKGSMSSPAPKHPPHSAHTPHHGSRPLDSPASTALLSPHAGRFVAQQAAQLQEAASPFDAHKFREQQEKIKQGEPV